ncbi:MAG: pyridoxamine 5'-phosphate oxidase family protein [Alistipes sp.]|nr:pyridoxamine 5'-phosphate oxidase family protein [Alistipes sp.]
MKFDNSHVRRQDRLLGEAEALEILRVGEYGYLSMRDEEGVYGVPVNYVLDGETIYFHSASEGRKLRCVEYDPRVSFCVVGSVELQPQELTTNYRSVIVSGEASIVEDDELKRHVLRLLVVKYSAQYCEQGNAAIQCSADRTSVISIEVESISAKCKE